MAEAKKASFSFKEFMVPNFSYSSSDKEDLELKLNFDPKGRYHKDQGIFELVIEFTGTDGKHDEQIVKVTSVAFFEFSKDLDSKDIPVYFYSNSIAIVFPYIRAFISNLTLQANAGGVIMLGLLNFSKMGTILKENTIYE
ncbi:hypothetical protein [Kordia sp.]|uniref:hypothetical protein n=1 Tax=Kordia sp. TaxID=1965332 RepID=UPI003D6A31E6